MTEDEREQIRQVLMSTLSISDDRVIGNIFYWEHPEPESIWIELNNCPFYLGPSHNAATLTAEIGDCWLEPRDGDLTDEDLEWFRRRATIRPIWSREETRLQEEQRRLRVIYNLEWVEGLVNSENKSFDQEILVEHQAPRVIEKPVPSTRLSFEFVRVKGWNGTWVLVDDLDSFRRATLQVTDDRYLIKFGESREAKIGLKLFKICELVSEDDELVELRMYDGDERKPSLVLRKAGEQIVVDELNVE